MLKLENVSKIYYSKGMIATGITKVNLELKLGEFVVITGQSGSGKSTLLNVISGIDSYEEGEMYINGKETSHYTEKDFEDYRRKYIANIFQSFNLINSYTVYQNIELGLLLNGENKKDVKQKILDMISKVGLEKFKNTKVSKLSGGQKQRVAIARAMVKDTPIIVADEPTGNLDTKSAEEVIEILKKISKDKLVVVVTHNIEQVEKYATRIIKMHDGRMVQNTQIKEIEEEKEIKNLEYKNITILNKYRLGIRNTFNIIPKFMLLFAVFLFMSLAFLTEYAMFRYVEEANDNGGYSSGFMDLSDERLLIKKQDGTTFNNEDYEKIKNISNVNYIVKDDVFIDELFFLQGENMSLRGNVFSINNLKEKPDIGRMPENSDEVVIKISKDHFYIEKKLYELLNSTFSLLKSYDMPSIGTLRIVGIKYSDNFEEIIYAKDELLSELRTAINEVYSNVKVLLGGKYSNFDIKPNKNVKKGYAIINDYNKYRFSSSKIVNQPININTKNIYYEENVNLIITSTFTRDNFKALTGLDEYDDYQDTIFISYEDYNLLYNKSPYQSSVYVNNKKNVNKAFKELENLGLIVKKVSDFQIDDSLLEKQMIRIVKVIFTAIVIIVLFFISYLIIRIILKSRNIYYTTLRMLGATYKNVKRILDIELFVNSSLAYASILVCVYLVKIGTISIELFENLVKYLTLKEYIMMYVILVIISRLISNKFSRKIFKNTALNAYNEEV